MAYSKVLAALDVAADSAEMVLQRAADLVGADKVTAVHVLDNSYLYYGDDVAMPGAATLHEQARTEVNERLAKLCAATGVGSQVVLEGHPATEIHRYADENGVDLVVIGTHGRHGWRLILGSTANAVLHGTHCNVLAVRVPEDS